MHLVSLTSWYLVGLILRLSMASPHGHHLHIHGCVGLDCQRDTMDSETQLDWTEPASCRCESEWCRVDSGTCERDREQLSHRAKSIVHGWDIIGKRLGEVSSSTVRSDSSTVPNYSRFVFLVASLADIRSISQTFALSDLPEGLPVRYCCPSADQYHEQSRGVVSDCDLAYGNTHWRYVLRSQCSVPTTCHGH